MSRKSCDICGGQLRPELAKRGGFRCQFCSWAIRKLVEEIDLLEEIRYRKRVQKVRRSLCDSELVEVNG